MQPLASRAKGLREEAEYAAKLLAEADEEANSKKGKKGGKGKPAKGKPEAAASPQLSLDREVLQAESEQLASMLAVCEADAKVQSDDERTRKCAHPRE